MLKPVLVTPPAADKPLISLDDAKKHLRVDHDEDNVYIESLVAAATSWLDGYSGVLGRALINQTWMIHPEWCPEGFRLPLAPVSSVTSVKYFDADNVEQTVVDTNYNLYEDLISPFVQMIPTYAFPATYDRLDDISITFVAGYGADATNIPGAIIIAAKLLIGHFYENREATAPAPGVFEMPLAVKALITPYRRGGF